MPKSAKILLISLGLVAVLSGIGVLVLSGQEASRTTEPSSGVLRSSESTDPTKPVSIPIDYQLQGYLAYKNEIISQAKLTIYNPETPPLSNESDGTASDFEYMHISDFPLIENEASCCTTRELNDHILELKLTKLGTSRNPETGSPQLTIEAEYTVLIDQATSEFLMCSIRTFLDNSTQQYYFITTNSTRIISQILDRAYST